MYEAPKLIDLGSFADITLDTIHKKRGGFDTVIYDDGTTDTIPGHGATIS